MSALPCPLPPVPLSADQSSRLAALASELDAAALWWASGYAAGLARGRSAEAVAELPPPAPAAPPAARLTIVYGSQTGNARRVAEQLARQAEARGLATRVLRADAYPLRELKDERHLYLVVSTQGDGDPPDDTRALLDFLGGRRAPSLPDLRYAVLGLGDSSYPQFCAVGVRLDARLAELGAARALGRADADLDIEAVATPWIANAVEAAANALEPTPRRASVTPLRPAPPVAVATREHPRQAELLANQRITGRGSDRDIRHLEFALDLPYEPGDAIGIQPLNPPLLVDQVIAALRLDGDAEVEHRSRRLPLREWLSSAREITRLSRPVLAAHAARARSTALDALLAPARAGELAALFARSQLLDLLQAHPADWDPADLVATLRPLSPRLYSIASSRKAVGDEAHLTVAHVAYRRGDALRWGAASHFLARAAEGESLPVYIEANQRFRLPAPDRDVVMIGPGTGVAPFRGFVQEREAVGAGGRNWLLFGNPHARSDFLYQLEWQEALRRGSLHRLDVAFSRDQADKVYVQHRLREHGRELFDWMEGGAHLYVCGATAMAKDVHAALSDVVASHGGRSPEDAAGYLDALLAQGRYARDVY